METVNNTATITWDGNTVEHSASDSKRAGVSNAFNKTSSLDQNNLAIALDGLPAIEWTITGGFPNHKTENIPNKGITYELFIHGNSGDSTAYQQIIYTLSNGDTTGFYNNLTFEGSVVPEGWNSYWKKIAINRNVKLVQNSVINVDNVVVVPYRILWMYN